MSPARSGAAITLLDDHLLLRALVGNLPARVASRQLMTTTAWWWRALAPLASPPTPAVGRHRAFADHLGVLAREALVEALAHTGQPGSTISVHELVPLQPAMARLARDHHLNRLQAEAVAVALSVGARVRVRSGHEGRLAAVATEFGIDLDLIDL